MRLHRHGFTLVELSIVLVIIGLLVGGILGGQELIRAAELNSITTDATKYKVATNAFRLKYNALPGDMKNATDYWGTNPNCAARTPGTGTQTCNGNGDGLLLYTAANLTQEQFYFWKHLSNAGIVPGNFGGAGTSCPGTATAANCPEGRISNSYWTAFIVSNVIHDGSTGGGWSTWWYQPQFRNYLLFGRYIDDASAAGFPALNPTDAFNIDSKMDDGNPGLGNWRSFGGPNIYSQGCAVNASTKAALTDGTRASAAASAYNVAEPNLRCALFTYLE